MAHEISHMWFGNMVTMQWWNNIWLNESFADFFSYLCCSHLHKKIPYNDNEYYDEWLSFAERKQWGYYEDSMEDTTHSIVSEIKNTSEANTVFDGISYSKGAAALHQLYCLIGEDIFFLALQKYFTIYRWKCTTLESVLNTI